MMPRLRMSVSSADMCAALCVACGVYGVSLVSTAAAWLALAVVLGCVAVELAGREVAAAGGRKPERGEELR